MQIVIDIPDIDYETIELFGKFTSHFSMNDIVKIIKNGIKLPKGHGRLIDADEYKEHLYACETNGRPLHIMELDERLATVDEVPTIIEADTTERK